MSGFGGGGFGQPPAQQPFGSATPNHPPAGGFGAPAFGAPAATSTPFGGGFGGSPPAAPSSGFGSSPNVVTGGFGQAPSTSGFGSAPAAGFGGGMNSSMPNSSSPFGSSGGQSGGFGQPSAPSFNNASIANNPFMSAASAPSVSFGSSSNVVTNSNSSGQPGFGSSSNTFQTSTTFGSNPFGSNSGSNSNPFQNDSGMQQQSDNEDMADGTMSPKPFGFQKRGLSPVHEEARMADSSSPVPHNRGTAEEEQRLKKKMEEKKVLQAKIEEKKRKLLEKQNKKKQTKEETSSLNADASPFVPSAGGNSLAERNAMRFARHLDDRSSSPQPLPTSNTGDSTSNDKGNRQDLKSAVSLVGTCQNMCPDDELQRRERESDIQLLEIVQPGTLHPPTWTLLDTAVKRFRRSAADYKLDVPEWVRPPDVLEKVCSYLEEWIMERDRQGGDPRFPQGQTPPSLDVYQFVWDRTRMVRKDFTLQNYVGSGGNCDARAVRCHERIARWHAMCEHQLSHISDFTTAQSSQNIQELMQTMQSLNQFYDDSLRRFTVEVPDKNGKETRLNTSGLIHGCSAGGVVQGNSPVDYDGTSLHNAADSPSSARRLIGRQGTDLPSHGTAEPEMRGLYILLTMNTDGGMEVLKYAARLYRERPAIYHSKPVQLALSIYKAKKEYNYARFFSILKSPSTPYLFSCIMFKHVEMMRKSAFKIMSRTFGARKKDTGEAIYDAYPLTRLTDLLCFESAEEARGACKHYNIMVKPMKMTSSSGKTQVAEIVFWRHSDFSEPKNPKKGTIIPLQPWKMLRTIEKKVNGATRLAICRGDVSGEGASLETSAIAPFVAVPAVADTMARDEAARKRDAEILEHAHRVEQARKEKEAKRLVEEKEKLDAERRLIEAKRKEEELRKQLQQEKEREAAKQRLAEHQRKLFEEEKRKMEEEEKRKREEERIRMREAEAQKVREAELRKKQEEEARQRKLEEEKRRKAEEIERARRKEAELREKELQRQQAEIARKAKEEEDRKRREAEAARREMLRIQEEERKRKEAEERKKAREWKNRVSTAQKKIVWLRWRSIVARKLEMTKASSASLRAIDPTFSNHYFDVSTALHRSLSVRSRQEEGAGLGPLNSRRLIDRLISKRGRSMNLATMVVDALRDSSIFRAGVKSTDEKSTILLKVAVIVPQASTAQEESMHHLLAAWVGSRITFNHLASDVLESGISRPVEVRTVVKLESERTTQSNADVALFLVPEPWTTSAIISSFQFDPKVPRVALVLHENPGDIDGNDVNQEIFSHFTSAATNSSIVLPHSFPVEAPEDIFDKALFAAFEKLVIKFLQETVIYMDRCTVSELGSTVVREALWGTGHIAARSTNDSNVISAYAKSTLICMITEIESLRQANERDWSAWPPNEFAQGQSPTIKNYYQNGGLPLDWQDRLFKEYLEIKIAGFFDSFNGSYRDIVHRFLKDAPQTVREECTALLRRGHHNQCLARALSCGRRGDGCSGNEKEIIYLPRGMMEVIVRNTLESLREKYDEIALPTYGLVRLGGHPMEAERREVLMLRNSPNVVETPPLEPTNLLSKRRWEDTLIGYEDNAEDENEYADRQIVAKRPRETDETSVSEEQRESSAFTKRLQALLDGDTVDMIVGKSTLKSLLRSVPKL